MIRQLVLDVVSNAVRLADRMVGRLVFGYANSLLLYLKCFFAGIDNLSACDARETALLSKVRLAYVARRCRIVMSKVTSELRALANSEAILSSRLLVQSNAFLVVHYGRQPDCVWTLSHLYKRVDLFLIAIFMLVR